MTWVGRTPVGFIMVSLRSKKNWIGFRWGGDVRRVYEVMLRRGVSRTEIVKALKRAAPRQAEKHGLV